MMSEEVSISAWWMPSKILQLYREWGENRGYATSQKYLVDMYLYLTSQKMIRLISDLSAVYRLLDPAKAVAKINDRTVRQIHADIQTRYPQLYADQAEVGEPTWGVDMTKYPSKLHPCIRGVIYNLERGSDHVFYWISKLRELQREDKVPQYGYMKIIWEILHRFIDQNREYEFLRDTICALKEFYTKMTHKEKPIYLYHAVLLLVRRNVIDWSLQDPGVDTSMVEVEKLYADHLSDVKMEMDDYVLDMHTKPGKRSGNCYEKFGLEGAYVKKEDVRFLKQEYREIYILLKKELDLHCSRGRKIR